MCFFVSNIHVRQKILKIVNFQGWIDQIEYDEDEDEYIYEQANEEHGE